MTNNRITRRLAAIVIADVVGYSRLVAEDETATLNAVRTLRNDFWKPEIQSGGGRIVGTAGDGTLIEFQSAVAAIECAATVQKQMQEYNNAIPTHRQILLRIGVNIGEVVVDGDDILGDGVNVAARLEALATPGGICASDSVIREVQGKIDLPFADAGYKELKNIPTQVRIWQWTPESAAQRTEPTLQVRPALPDKPSIAVLPFINMSDNADQEFFADGMTEDIITDLSRMHSLFVIARNSSFAYKGSSPDIRDVGRELGVRYVLEGSIRHGGNRLRITAQLVEAASGSHIWADRFDREMNDIFAVQDEVTEAIVAAIAPEIDQAEMDHAKRKPPQSLDAWSLYQRGLSYVPSGAASDLQEAIKLFDAARNVDPNFTEAVALAGDSRVRYALFYHREDADALIGEAQELIQSATRQDRGNPVCALANAVLHLYLRDFDTAVASCLEAISLNPNSARTYDQLGFCLSQGRRPVEAIAALEKAERLSPRDPRRSGRYTTWAVAYFLLGAFEKSAEWARKASQSENPRFWGDAVLLASAIRLDSQSSIAAAKQSLYERRPEFSIADIIHYFHPEMVEALKEAEIPDE